MTTLVLRFPAGRYHAVPWVAVGEPDTPPSPWRLLRSLDATWRTRAPDLAPHAVHDLLGALAVPPTWFVPPCRIVGAAAVLDDDAELAAVWPGRLLPEQHAVLQLLAGAVPYLGRADRPCRGRVDDSWTPTAQHRRWEPLDVAEVVGRDRVTCVLGATLPLDPATLLLRPADVRRSALACPAGTRLLAYQRQAPMAEEPVATVVRLTVMGRRPPATETVAVTDLLRRAALARLGAVRGVQARTRLGGRDADESVLNDQHSHTSYLPIVADGAITALLAWTPAGLSPDEVAALRSITRLSSNRRTLRVRVGASSPAPVKDLAGSLIGPSTTWTSVTPYTPSRYAKKREWRTFLFDDLTREMRYRGLPAITALDVVDGDWRAWRRHRPSASRTSPQGRVTRDSAFLRLSFPEPVTGPLVVGHLSHFGLGLFAPDPRPDEAPCERSDAT